MINFPPTPVLDQEFTSGGKTWRWDGQKWIFVVAAAATPSGDNYIINGDMRIDQRNNGAGQSVTTSGVYTIDRWRYTNTVNVTARTVQRELNTGASQTIGFPYCFSFNSGLNNINASAALYASINQVIEADTIADLLWGTPAAKPVTLSFWYRNPMSGIGGSTQGGSIQNAAQNRSFPFRFVYTTASVWQKVVVTLPGDTAGTWVTSGAVAGALLHFTLAAGPTVTGPPNVWSAGNFVNPTGGQSQFGFGIVNITGVKLEIGSAETPFNRSSLMRAIADCQRYYNTLTGLATTGTATAGQLLMYESTTFPPMRANPTVVYSVGPANTNAGATLAAAAGTAVTPSSILSQASATAAGVARSNFNVTLTAEL